MKKKILLLPLILLFVFVISGCDKESGNEEKNKKEPDLENKLVLEENVDYKVTGGFTGKYLDVTKRGYYIDTLDEPNAPYFYIICMGEKNTGGYSLEIKEVYKVDDHVEIIIKENEPGPNDIVTMSFTYPTIIVEFPEYQENIIIKNEDGKKFAELD